MLKMNKNLFLAILALGVFFVLAAPETMAQTRCRTRDNNSRSVYNNRDYRDRDYRVVNNRSRDYRDSDYNYNDYGYRDREDTTGKALKRTGIGAGVGALGGAVIGGKKGALIGAGIGAAGGYIYHRQKAKNDRYRY